MHACCGNDILPSEYDNNVSVSPAICEWFSCIDEWRNCTWKTRSALWEKATSDWFPVDSSSISISMLLMNRGTWKQQRDLTVYSSFNKAVHLENNCSKPSSDHFSVAYWPSFLRADNNPLNPILIKATKTTSLSFRVVLSLLGGVGSA